MLKISINLFPGLRWDQAWIILQNNILLLSISRRLANLFYKYTNALNHKTIFYFHGYRFYLIICLEALQDFFICHWKKKQPDEMTEEEKNEEIFRSLVYKLIDSQVIINKLWEGLSPLSPFPWNKLTKIDREMEKIGHLKKSDKIWKNIRIFTKIENRHLKGLKNIV